MQLEDYFEIEQHEEGEHIRVKGTRIGIEIILHDYLGGMVAEQIASEYRTLSLEQVYATLTYYQHNREAVDAYLARVKAANDAAYKEYLQKEPPEVVKRLRALRAARQQGSPANS